MGAAPHAQLQPIKFQLLLFVVARLEPAPQILCPEFQALLPYRQNSFGWPLPRILGIVLRRCSIWGCAHSSKLVPVRSLCLIAAMRQWTCSGPSPRKSRFSRSMGLTGDCHVYIACFGMGLSYQHPSDWPFGRAHARHLSKSPRRGRRRPRVLCRWEGRPLWRALRFTIGRAFTPTLQCYLGTVPCILDGFRLFIVQFFGRPAPSDLGGACIVSRSYPRQFTDFLLLRIRMRFPVPSPAAYRAGLFLYECRRCEPN